MCIQRVSTRISHRWEYFTTFGFEWQIYTGKRPWRWSYLAYIAARTLCLISLIMAVVAVNLTGKFNCDVLYRFVLATAWLAASCASFLLMLRGVALWGRNRRIVMIAGLVWPMDFAATLIAITRSRSLWSTRLQTCILFDTAEFKWVITARFIVDCCLLGIMISGVFHQRTGTGTGTHIWHMLYVQGLFWITTAILTEVPGVVMPFLNINDAWNVMFHFPLFIVVVIASSRSFRDIFQNFSDDSPSQGYSDQYSNPQRYARNPLRASAAPQNGLGMQVAVKTMVECDDSNRGSIELNTLKRRGDLMFAT
ncbi:hypothetical protein BGW80DRAFT_519379 [Lactifluus volemus]|nr:hypothetical protein BGW80DRAFT_519379 [Lactifluus volemus]